MGVQRAKLEVVCCTCGNTFFAKRKTAKYCSDQCRRGAKFRGRQKKERIPGSSIETKLQKAGIDISGMEKRIQEVYKFPSSHVTDSDFSTLLTDLAVEEMEDVVKVLKEKDIQKYKVGRIEREIESVTHEKQLKTDSAWFKNFAVQWVIATYQLKRKGFGRK